MKDGMHPSELDKKKAALKKAPKQEAPKQVKPAEQAKAAPKAAIRVVQAKARSKVVAPPAPKEELIVAANAASLINAFTSAIKQLEEDKARAGAKKPIIAPKPKAAVLNAQGAAPFAFKKVLIDGVEVVEGDNCVAQNNNERPDNMQFGTVGRVYVMKKMAKAKQDPKQELADRAIALVMQEQERQAIADQKAKRQAQERQDFEAAQALAKQAPEPVVSHQVQAQDHLMALQLAKKMQDAKAKRKAQEAADWEAAKALASKPEMQAHPEVAFDRIMAQILAMEEEQAVKNARPSK